MSLNDIAKSEKNTPTKSVITFFSVSLFDFSDIIPVLKYTSLFFADFYMYLIKKYVNRKKYIEVT